MKKGKKVLLCIFSLLVILWCLRYYQLNNGKLVLHKYNEVHYGINEKVEYGDDIVIGKDEKSPGYTITLLKTRIVDCKDYLKEINKKEKDFDDDLPEKIAEITVDISNLNNNDSSQGVQFYPIWLIGRDWYEIYSAQFTAYANEICKDNPENTEGIQMKPGKSYTMKLIYPLRRADFTYFTWNNLNKEPMWLTITYGPTRKLICAQ